MTGMPRPSRPIAISMVAVAALLLIFGLVTAVREGFSPFILIWLAVGVFIAVALTRRLFAQEPGQSTRDTGMRPSRPMAVVVAVFGVGMAVFGIVRFGATDPLFTVLWVTALVCIVGGQVWSAFRPPR